MSRRTNLTNVLKPEMGVVKAKMPSMLTKIRLGFERFFHVSRGLSQHFAVLDGLFYASALLTLEFSNHAGFRND